MFSFVLFSSWYVSQWYHFWQWKPDVWSAIGTVVSAITILFLARYTIKSTSVLEQQARDSAIQAKVAVAMLRKLDQDAALQTERRHGIAAIRLADIRIDVINRRQTFEKGSLPIASPILPADWSEIVASILECRPELVNLLVAFDIECRKIEQILKDFNQSTHEREPATNTLREAFRAIEPSLDAIYAAWEERGNAIPTNSQLPANSGHRT